MEDELNRELKKKGTKTNNNHSRFQINKLLNEKQDELNKQLPSLNAVGITSPLESTSKDEDKSGFKLRVLYFHLLREIQL